MNNNQSAQLNHLALIQQALQKRNFSLAKKICYQALLEQSNEYQFWSLLIELLYQQRLFDEVIVNCQKCLILFPEKIRIISIYANALRYSNQCNIAIDILNASLLQFKQSHFLYNQLGLIYKESHQPQKAIIAFEKCLHITPDFAEAYWNKTTINKYLSTDEIDQLLLFCKNSKTSNKDKVYYHYSLFSHFDFCGSYQQAFLHLETGAKIQRSIINYQHQKALSEFKNIRTQFNSKKNSNFTRQNHIKNNRIEQPHTTPLFILGMPRSGTTLVEQIICSHPLVTGGDETHDFVLATEQILQEKSITTQYPDWLKEFENKDFDQLATFYFERTKRLQKTPFFTDKTLMNFKAINLILQTIPHAKIIHCTRDPMDNILSCYQQLFNDGMNFTYQLDELAETFLEYLKIMKLWKKIFVNKIIDVHYENLIMNQKKQTERLLNFIGLNFHEDCLAFYNNARNVHTMSTLQVKKPIYTSSVGKWKNYSEPLKKIAERFN